MHKLTGLCGSLGLPTLCPGCTLRGRSSHNPLRPSGSMSFQEQKGKETEQGNVTRGSVLLLRTEPLAVFNAHHAHE